MPHSIVPFLPLTKQTDPNAFPPYAFREYPKQMLKTVTQEDVDVWMEKNVKYDENKGMAKYWPGGRPKVGGLIAIDDENGEPATVLDPEEEAEFRAAHPEAVLVTNSSRSADDMEEIAKLRAENARLRAERSKTEDPDKPEEVKEPEKPGPLQTAANGLKGKVDLPPRLK